MHPCLSPTSRVGLTAPLPPALLRPRLANAQGDILEDIELIENLEVTKRTAVDIEEKVKLAKTTEVGCWLGRAECWP